MARKVSIINMKGGVGKSTLATNLAWHFAAKPEWRKRVLLVDLDPQFNASQYLLGVDRYKREIIDANAPTVWDVFEQQSRAPGLRAANRQITDAVRRVDTLDGGSYIDLLPSQFELSATLKNPGQKEHLLANFVSDVEAAYDLVLIDCAPTESVLTTAAYQASDAVLIPVKPEFLSTIGLPLIRQSLGDFSRSYRKQVEVAGVVFNMCGGASPDEARQKYDVRTTAGDFGWHVFAEEVPYSQSFPKGAGSGSPIFTTAYARTTVADGVGMFCNAFAQRIGL